MSIVLQPNSNCIDREQLYSDLEILSKYTTQSCNSTFGNKTKWVQLIMGLQAIQNIHKPFGNEKNKQIRFPFFLRVTTPTYGVSETALHTDG